MKKKTQEEINTLRELKDEVYTAEDLIDGSYSVKLFKDKYPKIDELHKETLSVLRKYFNYLNKLKL